RPPLLTAACVLLLALSFSPNALHRSLHSFPTRRSSDLLVRQEQEGSALLFAGHTRTSDVERLVQLGWLTDVRAMRRVLTRVILRDRKSTRLNSSHVKISYAVFCLKKKIRTGTQRLSSGS